MTAWPIFHVVPKGWLGSRMFQYLMARKFSGLVPGCRISNMQFPEWEIDHPPLAPEPPIELAREPHHVELTGLAERARSGAVRTIVYSSYGQRLENLPDLDTCRAAFRPPVVSPARFGERYLVCHVPAPEAAYAVQEATSPLAPIGFYADVVAQTGLIPVFVGRRSSGEYADRLRARFPRGVFLDTGDPIVDFEIIRQAQNIAIGVSSFAWLAAWLSYAERIFLTVTGRFSPMQDCLVDLLPFGDARYRFYLLPVSYAMPPHRQLEVHDRIAPLGRFVGSGQLQRMLHDAPRFDPTLEQILEEFDPKYYLATNQDVAEKFGTDDAEAARRHYRESGVREQRLPFELSARWYAAQYPLAAFEVAQGDYSNFAQHYVAVGRAHRYRLRPDDDDRTWDDASSREPVPLTTPSIAVLAKEVLCLDSAVTLDPEITVSLGDSFRRHLSPDLVASFARLECTQPMHIYRLRDAVLDVSMMALFNRHQPIRDTLYMMPPAAYEHALVKPLEPEPTNVTMHYIMGCNASFDNYYHWMAQSLPAIDWGMRCRRHPNVAIAVPALQSWQIEALALLGHAGVPRLTLRQAAHYALDSVEYAEFLGARLDRIASHAAAETYARLRRAVVPAADGGDAIYIARTDTTRRPAVNEAALIVMLEQRGVRIIVPGALPVTRQLALFRRARLVIGPHGAGLTNMVACEPGSHIYELVPSHYPNHCYNRLAQSCRLHYWADVFPAEPGDAATDRRRWHIDLDLVAARLDEICTRMMAVETTS